MSRSSVSRIDGLFLPILFLTSYGNFVPYNFSPYLHSGPQLLTLVLFSLYLLTRFSLINRFSLQYFTKSKFTWKIFTCAVLLFYLSNVIGSLSSSSPTDSLLGEPSRRLGLLTWTFIVVNSFLFVLNHRKFNFFSEQIFSRIFYGYLFIGFAQGVSIINFLGSKNNVGILSNEDLYSLACGIAALISLFKLGENISDHKVLHFFVLIVAIYEVIRSEALSGVIPLLVGLVFLFIRNVKVNIIKYRIFISLLLALVIIAIFFSPFVYQDPNTQIRISLWKTIWNLTISNLKWFGHGFDSMIYYLVPKLNYNEIWAIEGIGRNQIWDNPHSSFFTFLYTGGLLGSVGYLIYVIVGLFLYLSFSLFSADKSFEQREIRFISTVWVGLLSASQVSVGNPLLFQLEFLTGFSFVYMCGLRNVELKKVVQFKGNRIIRIVLHIIFVIVVGFASILFINRIYIPEKEFRQFANMPKVNIVEINSKWENVLDSEIQCGHALYVIQNPSAYTIKQSEDLGNVILAKYPNCPTAKLLLLIVGLNSENSELVKRFGNQVLDWNPDLFKLRNLINEYNAKL